MKRSTLGAIETTSTIKQNDQKSAAVYVLVVDVTDADWQSRLKNNHVMQRKTGRRLSALGYKPFARPL